MKCKYCGSDLKKTLRYVEVGEIVNNIIFKDGKVKLKPQTVKVDKTFLYCAGCGNELDITLQDLEAVAEYL